MRYSSKNTLIVLMEEMGLSTQVNKISTFPFLSIRGFSIDQWVGTGMDYYQAKAIYTHLHPQHTDAALSRLVQGSSDSERRAARKRAWDEMRQIKPNLDQMDELLDSQLLTLNLEHRHTRTQPSSEDNIKLLLGPSGCGKTRFCLELLCANHGLYFVANRDKIGSKDMKRCVVNMMKDPLNAEMHITLWFKTRLRILEMVKHSVTDFSPKVSLFCQLFTRDVQSSRNHLGKYCQALRL